jgi:LysM repeat protein
MRFDTVSWSVPMDLEALLEVGGLDEATLREYNPHLREGVWSGARLVPSGMALRVPEGLGSRLDEARLPASAQARTSGSGYVVRTGDTLAGIAASLGTTVDVLQLLNSIADTNLIFPGQVLQTALGGGASDATTYQVRAGDTLARIARRFGVSLGLLQETNGIVNPHQIYLGQVLMIPR